MSKPVADSIEFSRSIGIDRLDQDGIEETITADEGERQALAQRFGLLALDSLSAKVSLRRVGQGPIIRVAGELRADVVQSCVVSLEPISNRIEQGFTMHFAPEHAGALNQHVDEIPSVSDDDVPEPLIDRQVDIGEAVAQQLALALDPYPRKPGVRLEDVIGQAADGSPDKTSDSPFAALARLSTRNS